MCSSPEIHNAWNQTQFCGVTSLKLFEITEAQTHTHKKELHTKTMTNTMTNKKIIVCDLTFLMCVCVCAIAYVYVHCMCIVYLYIWLRGVNFVLYRFLVWIFLLSFSFPPFSFFLWFFLWFFYNDKRIHTDTELRKSLNISKHKLTKVLKCPKITYDNTK